MEGMILGDRYELIEKIGGGGMAVVYKAKCKLLNRFVAVKILRPEFTNDEEFVKRFRVEAQSAASLSHPNIVPIYDVGNQGDIYYIVMEYVNGISLKEYIENKGSLDWKEAVKIEIQICSAIENAHGNHIIHRDIKPHNILLTKDGIAKVTDFGIARAVSSSTISMAGSTIGSVHYFSPEQARGGFVDEKSDLYSMGITLYEMVTGKVPFDGETPVAVALKHIQINAEEPNKINPVLPKGVNEIIMKAIKKEQNERYQTAKEMLDDLNKVLMQPEGGFITSKSTSDDATIRIKTIGEEDLLNKDEYLAEEKSNKKVATKKNDKVIYWLAGITSFVIIVILVIISFKFIVPNVIAKNGDFITENYVGKNITEVATDLTAKKIEYKTRDEFSSKIAKDIIISQDIAAGQSLKPGGYNTITFVVSKGIEKYKIIDFNGVVPILYEKGMTDAGLKVTEKQEFSDTIGVGQIIRTEPAIDTEVDTGSTVVVVFSKGSEILKTKIPKLIGMTQTQAIKAILKANLALGNIFPENVSSIDKVIKQEPKAGLVVDEKTPINLTFSDSSNQTLIEKHVSVTLANETTYGDTIKVVVTALPSNDAKSTIIFNETKNKSDFPIDITVLVPSSGSVLLNIFLDDKAYDTLTITPAS